MYRYKEPLKSKIPVTLRYFRFSAFYIKSRFVRRGESERYKQRLNDLKKTFHEKDYPEGLLEAKPRKKVAVYTVVFGNYERIKPIKTKSPYCDYFIVTDQPADDALGWTKLDPALPEEIKDKNNTVKNRYFKMHPHLLFPEYEYSLYIDGSIEPKYDLFPLFGRLGEKFIGMFRLYRDCIYKEAEAVVRVGKASREDVNKLIKRYEEEGFPHGFGLTEGCTIARKHSDPRCVKLMNDWWDTFMSGPKRDQLSFMYCIWKNGYTIDDVGYLGLHYDMEPRIVSEGHYKK